MLFRTLSATLVATATLLGCAVDVAQDTADAKVAQGDGAVIVVAHPSVLAALNPGYAAGFFYGLLSGEPEEEAVKLGWAHGALLTTFPGDTTMATVEQVRAFAKGGSARMQR